MIKVDSDYYYSCDDQQAKMEAQPIQESRPHKDVIEDVGDVKQYLSAVSNKIRSIKQLRTQQKKQKLQNNLILDQLNLSERKQQSEQDLSGKIQIMIPESIYKLQQRLAKIESKFNNNEIFRQKIQRKGKLSERIKFLNSKIQTLISKSPDIIISNIQNYYQGLDQKKQQQMKTLFLYEASSSTKGLMNQIDVLSIYLQNLNQIQLKVKGMTSKQKIVENHESLLRKRQKVSEKIAKLSEHMKEEYEKCMKQIDSI